MPEDEFDPTTDESEEHVVTLRRAQIRVLEEKAKRADDAESRASSAERRLAMHEAGLDLADPKVRFFAEHYDGAPDAQAIRAAAAESGFAESTPPPSPEAEAAQRLAGASAGAQAPPPESSDAELNERLARASSREEVMDLLTRAGKPTAYNRPWATEPAGLRYGPGDR